MAPDERQISEAREINRAFYADYYKRPLYGLRYEYIYRQRIFKGALRKMGLPASGQRVLDVGFGYGDLLFTFDPSCDLHGLEISPSAVEVARQRARRRRYTCATFTEHDLHNLIPYPDGSFDLVICSHLLEHIENAEAVLADLCRVLKPEGSALVFLPIHEESFSCERSKHIWKYTRDGFRQMAERCRFRVAHTLEHQFFDMPFKALGPFGRRHPRFDLMRRVVQYVTGFIIVMLGGARGIDLLLAMVKCRATCLFVVLRKGGG